MPNYTLVADTTFKNRSFDDLIRPFQMYTEMYNQMADSVNELDTKASVWEGMANEQSDPVAYAQYKRYADELRTQAKLLATNGTSPSTRQDILNLRRRYASEIAPIENAYTTRKEQAAEQRKALNADPTLLLSRRADATSLDDYLANPTLGYESYSGAVLASQVGNAAKALAKELKNYGNGKRLDAYTKTWIEQHGFTAEEVAHAINNPDDPKSSKVLRTLVDNVMADSGIHRWADYPTLNQAYNYARQGLWEAVGVDNVHPYEDYGARLNKQLENQRKMAEEAARRNIQHTLLIPRALRNTEEISKNNKEIDKYVSKGLMLKVGDKYELTELGKKEYMNEINRRVPNYNPDELGTASAGYFDPILPNGLRTTGVIPESPTGTTSYKQQSDFRRFIDKLNGGSPNAPILDDNNQIDVGRVESLFNDFVDANREGSYDMYHSTEYIRQLDDSYAKEVKRQLMSEPEVFQKLTFNGREGFKGERIKKEDLKNYEPTRVTYSKYGNSIIWIDDDGNSIRTNAPADVNERVTGTVKSAIANADYLAAVLRTGKVPMFENGKPVIKNGVLQFEDTPLTPQMVRAYYNDWVSEMDIVNSIGSMYVTPSVTAPTKYVPYEFSFGMQNMFDSSHEEE